MHSLESNAVYDGMRHSGRYLTPRFMMQLPLIRVDDMALYKNLYLKSKE